MARRPPGGTRAQRAGVEARRRMGVSLSIDVGGKDKVIKNLNRLKLNVGRRVLNRAIAQASARIMQPAIDANISTVSPGRFGTGLLKDRSTEVFKISRKATHIGYAVYTPTRTELNIQGDEVYYPFVLEVGGNGLEGQHMLKRARDQKSRSVRTFLRRTIRKFMEDEIRRIAGKNADRIAKGKSSISAFRSLKQRLKFKRQGIL